MMQGFRCEPLERVRVGIVGAGRRGMAAVERLPRIPGVEIVAVADIERFRLDEAAASLAKRGLPPAAAFLGPESFRAVADHPDVDVVYVTAPWPVHVPAAVYALEAGRHCAVEVPCAMTVEGCWRLVETVERARRHLIPLENCIYGEEELFAHALCAAGDFGEIVHGEGAYIHDLAAENFAETDGCRYFTALRGTWNRWRLAWNAVHDGNPYPTHGLAPLCRCMGVNRGDRIVSVVSMGSRQAGITAFARRQFGEDSPEARASYALADMNVSLMRTEKGRLIEIKHAVQSPRPYSRINLISGTRGTLVGYPLRVAMLPDADRWLDAEALAALRAKRLHPLLRDAWDAAKRQGGHGGMDWLMDLRWTWCLRNGLPMDADVCDAATWSCLAELSAQSVAAGSAPLDFPDFTRGGWKSAPPPDPEDMAVPPAAAEAALEEKK